MMRQITIPKKIMDQIPEAKYFEVEFEDGQTEPKSKLNGHVKENSRISYLSIKLFSISAKTISKNSLFMLEKSSSLCLILLTFFSLIARSN
jgi:hypothetical protein